MIGQRRGRVHRRLKRIAPRQAGHYNEGEASNVRGLFDGDGDEPRDGRASPPIPASEAAGARSPSDSRLTKSPCEWGGRRDGAAPRHRSHAKMSRACGLGVARGRLSSGRGEDRGKNGKAQHGNQGRRGRGGRSQVRGGVGEGLCEMGPRPRMNRRLARAPQSQGGPSAA